MDGVHDMGGKPGFGRVRHDNGGSKPFPERWEGAVFAMVRAARPTGAISNTDQFRHAIERIDPQAYLTHGYYGRWLGGLETLLTESGVLDPGALEARLGEQRLVAARPNPEPDAVPAPESEAAAETARRPLTAGPAFAVGAGVRTVARPVPHHTRLPAYARGRLGEVVAHHDGWVLPDTNAHGRGEAPAHLYTVAFAGAELWGGATEPGVTVMLDLFEPYLEPA